MSLILAIEPNRRQSLTLTSLSRARLNVELVLGETIGRAFEALGTRTPDLVLTSPGLTPNDEAALTRRLRALEYGGMPVPRLVTPQLGPPPPEKKGNKVGRLKGPHAPPGPVHCDPLVFSEQIANSLEMAAAERAALAAAQAEFEAAWATDVTEGQPRARSMTAALSSESEAPVVRTPVAAVEEVSPESVEVFVEQAPTVSAADPASSTSDRHVEEYASNDSVEPWEELFLEAATAPATDTDTTQSIAPPACAVEADATDADLDRFVHDLEGAPVRGSALAAPEMDWVVADREREPDGLRAHESPEHQSPEHKSIDGCGAWQENEMTVSSNLALSPPETDDLSEEVVLAEQVLDSPVEWAVEPEMAAAAVVSKTEDAPSRTAEHAEAMPVETAAEPTTEVKLEVPLHLTSIPRVAPALAAPTGGWQDVLSAIRRDIQQLRGDEAPLQPRPTAHLVDDSWPALQVSKQPPLWPEPSPVVAPQLVGATAPIEPSAPMSEASHEAEAAGSTVESRDSHLVSMPWRPRVMPRSMTPIVPAKDEWGFFDPHQCGFEALREKLREMTEAHPSAN
jgi:hypothetical protein